MSQNFQESQNKPQMLVFFHKNRMVKWCQIVSTNKIDGRIFVNWAKTTGGQEGWTFHNEEWCSVQNGAGQRIEIMSVNHKSSKGDEGVA